MEPRLKTEIWVKALVRRCQASGVPAMIVRRGDDTAGAVLVKVNLLDGRAHVYSQARGLEGHRIWLRRGEAQAESQSDFYIAAQVKVDRDVWVVEIEDRQGRHFLTEPVEE